MRDEGCQRCLVDFCEDHMRNLPKQETIWEKIGEASVNDHGEPIPVVMEKIVDRFAPKEDEDQYEHIDFILKARTDGTSWFDILHDYITQDCDSVEISEDEWSPCSCGMESMGGMSGTLQQCYDHGTNLGQGLQPIDVARALVSLADSQIHDVNAVAKVVNWARKEIEFEESWESNDDED